MGSQGPQLLRHNQWEAHTALSRQPDGANFTPIWVLTMPDLQAQGSKRKHAGHVHARPAEHSARLLSAEYLHVSSR